MKSNELLKIYKTKLFMAVRDTLETMAFADVMCCDDALDNAPIADASEFAGAAEDAWGVSGDAWGEPAGGGADDAWGTTPPSSSDEVWGDISPQPGNAPVVLDTNGADPLETFNQCITQESEFIWSRVRVECNEIHYVYLIAAKSLAQSLTDTMYAGDDCQSDFPFYRDTIAELANTLCGRLMLSLEEHLGMFKLSVPETGEGMPSVPDLTLDSKVLVDGTHAVLTIIEFLNEIKETDD